MDDWGTIQELVNHYLESGKPAGILEDIMTQLAPFVAGISSKKYWDKNGLEEDISQKTLIRIMTFLQGNALAPVNIKAICYDFIKKTFIDHLRKQENTKDKEIPVETLNESDSENNPWPLLDAREKLSIILDFAKNHCKPKHFQIILILWKLQMTHAEAAQHLGLTPSAVQSVEYRFKKKLLEHLENLGLI